MITPLQSRLVGVLLAGVQQDRMGATTDAPTSTIRGVIHSFVDVNMYKKKSTLQVKLSLPCCLAEYVCSICCLTLAVLWSPGSALMVLVQCVPHLLCAIWSNGDDFNLFQGLYEHLGKIHGHISMC